PTTLRIHQGQKPVRLLLPGLIRETTEEPLPGLLEPLSNLLGNLRVQRLELGVPPPQIQSELPKLVPTHTVLVLLILLLLGVQERIIEFTCYFKLGF
ncbi:hypothetical protein B9Q04_13700, partial [Candidatus Marsarchaeota G2 archaeon BE_D]